VQRREFAITDTGSMRLAGREAAANPSNQIAAAYSLCALGRANGIDCAVVAQPGKHDWPFADRVFESALPWLAGQLGTPGIPRVALPDASSSAAPTGTTVVSAQHSR
jgi:S-formylglutathione hydrolase FrmB